MGVEFSCREAQGAKIRGQGIVREEPLDDIESGATVLSHFPEEGLDFRRGQRISIGKGQRERVSKYSGIERGYREISGWRGGPKSGL